MIEGRWKILLISLTMAFSTAGLSVLVDDSIFDANVLILGLTSVGENFKPRESSSVWGVVSWVSVRLITVCLLSSGFIKGVVNLFVVEHCVNAKKCSIQLLFLLFYAAKAALY